MASPIASLLSKHSRAELGEMLAQAEEEIARLRFEVRVLGDAMAMATNTQVTVVTATTTTTRSTREYVLRVLGDAPEALTPRQIMAAEADPPKPESVYNTLSRMVKEGVLVRRDGAYKLAPVAGPDEGPADGANENGAGESLSTTT